VTKNVVTGTCQATDCNVVTRYDYDRAGNRIAIVDARATRGASATTQPTGKRRRWMRLGGRHPGGTIGAAASLSDKIRAASCSNITTMTWTALHFLFGGRNDPVVHRSKHAFFRR
jgi:hypothetical protein